MAIAATVNVDVASLAAIQGVIADAAGQRVGAAPSEQQVIAGAAVKRIISAASLEPVVTAEAAQRVVTFTRLQVVIPGVALERVGVRAAHDMRLIDPRFAEELRMIEHRAIGEQERIQVFGARERDAERMVRHRATDLLVSRQITAQRDGKDRSALERRLLTPQHHIGSGNSGAEGDRGLSGDVISRVANTEDIRIVSRPAEKPVPPRAAIKNVVARHAEERVVPFAGNERVVAIAALQLIGTGTAVEDVVAFQAGDDIVARQAVNVVCESSADEHRMSGVMTVVVLFGADDRESASKDIGEAQDAAVREDEALEGGGRARIGVIEARKVDRASVAEVEKHRAGAHRQRVGVETLTEHKNAGLGASRMVKDLIATVAGAEDIGVLSSTANQYIIARAADQDIVAAVSLEVVIAGAAVQIIVAFLERDAGVVADDHIGTITT